MLQASFPTRSLLRLTTSFFASQLQPATLSMKRKHQETSYKIFDLRSGQVVKKWRFSWWKYSCLMSFIELLTWSKEETGHRESDSQPYGGSWRLISSALLRTRCESSKNFARLHSLQTSWPLWSVSSLQSTLKDNKKTLHYHVLKVLESLHEGAW